MNTREQLLREKAISELEHINNEFTLEEIYAEVKKIKEEEKERSDYDRKEENEYENIINLKRKAGWELIVVSSSTNLCLTNEISLWYVVNTRQQVRKSLESIEKYLKRNTIPFISWNNSLEFNNWSKIIILSNSEEVSEWMTLDVNIVVDMFEDFDIESYKRNIEPMLARKEGRTIFYKYEDESLEERKLEENGKKYTILEVIEYISELEWMIWPEENEDQIEMNRLVREKIEKVKSNTLMLKV